MAFKSQNLGLFTSSTGTSGFLTYTTGDDTVAAVKGNGFWATDLSGAANAQDKRARDSAETFVKKQRPAAGRGVPILILGATDGMEMDEAYLHTDGRIRMRGGNWNIT